ncbi:MAG: bifunctional folylpolyglutamate synthase/dihydrofolate synthase [Tepidisphaerales bacterium]
MPSKSKRVVSGRSRMGGGNGTRRSETVRSKVKSASAVKTSASATKTAPVAKSSKSADAKATARGAGIKVTIDPKLSAKLAAKAKPARTDAAVVGAVKGGGNGTAVADGIPGYRPLRDGYSSRPLVIDPLMPWRMPKADGRYVAPDGTSPAKPTPPPPPLPAAVSPTPPGFNTLATLGGSDVAPNSAYGKALKVLSTLADYEHRRIVRYTPENFNLDRMRALLKRLGDPHLKFRSVHVAGTKGKGSTCAMIAAMVQANGYKTGLYTSPHLVDIRERIQINGEMISREDFARLVKAIEPHLSKVKPQPSYFDVLTAIAFLYFAEQKVELAVVETGLGGRLDSTNVIKPEVTCITAISYDHMAQLGNTLEKIASEKAGIFKPGVPAVVAMQEPSVEAVFTEHAAKVGCPVDICGRTIEFSYRFESSRGAGPHYRLCLTTPTSRFEHLAVPLVGEHQALNCGLALSVVDKLKQRGLAMSEARCLEGLARAYIPGRMELVSTSPRVVVDGAHNAASIDALMRSIGQHFSYDSMVLVFGCCADKDVKGMLEKIACGADKVIFTRVSNIRTCEPEQLAQQYTEMFGKMCQVAPDLLSALSIARRAVSRDDLICVTGSFYLVGEAKRIYPRPGPIPAVPAATAINLVAAGVGVPATASS